MKNCVYLVLAPLLFLHPHLSHAQTAKAVYVKGDITVTENAKKTTVKKGDQFGFGFILDTAAGSQVVWELEDGSRLKVSENTNLKIGIKPEEPHVMLNKGSLYAKITETVRKKGDQPKIKFKLQTKNAVLGIRGTQFFVSYGGEKSGGRDEWMCVNEGEVVIAPIQSRSVRPVLLKAGEGIQITVDGQMSQPKAFEWTKQLNWTMDEEKGSLDHPSKIKWAQ